MSHTNIIISLSGNTIIIIALHLVQGIQLTLLTSCTCLRQEVVYQCTVNGSGATTWGGTALEECSQGRILLRHSDYRPGYIVSMICGTNGLIRTHAVSAENGTYTSQLHLSTSNYTVGDTIECSGGSEEGVESAQISLSSGI